MRFLLIALWATMSSASAFGQAVWWQAQARGAPGDILAFGLAYDKVSGSTLLFGGGVSVIGNATWSWDGATWTLLAPPASPPARAEPLLVAMPDRGHVLMHGGNGGAGLINDTWIWDGQTWSLASPVSAPPGRLSSGIAYDAHRSCAVLFGGRLCTGCLGVVNDTWEWTGTDWVQRAPLTPPPPRRDHAMAYHASSGEVVLFGGRDSQVRFGDTWLWNGSSWTQWQGAPSPSPRYGHSMFYDTLRDRVVLAGGNDGVVNNEETWEWDGNSWTHRSRSLQPALRADPAAFDTDRNVAVVYGIGRQPFGYETWEYGTRSPARYTNIAPGCSGPTGEPRLRARSHHLPWIGDDFAVELAIPAGATSALLLTDLTRADRASFPLPLALAPFGMPGCTLVVAPDASGPLSLAGGTVQGTIPIPRDAGLIGRAFAQQAIVAVSIANPAGALLSNATLGVFGMR